MAMVDETGAPVDGDHREARCGGGGAGGGATVQS